MVFEGIDGSGKTTLSNRVAARLRERGLGVTHVREQGRFASPVTQSIRELGRDQRNLAMTPRAEMLLMVARDLQLLEEATLPALRSSDVVLADRYLYTAEVLAEYGRGLPVADVARVVAAAAGDDLEPDLVVLVDVDPHLARARRAVAKLTSSETRPSSRKGLAGRGLQHRLREGYLALAARDPGRWIVVDNSEAALAAVEAALADGLWAARRFGVARGRERLRDRLQALAEGSGPTPVATTIAAARRCFLDWVDRRAHSEPAVAAYMLARLSGPGIDERRSALVDRAPEVIAWGLRGLDDDVSWRLRCELLESAPQLVAASLLGPAGAGAAACWLRRELAPAAPVQVAGSLLGCDDAEAWQLREELFARAPHAVVASLAGLDRPRAWELRAALVAELGGDAAWADFALAETLCRSVTGLDDDRAWAIRERAYPTAPAAALESLTGVHSPCAQVWRERHLERAPRPVLKSLAGADHDHAWELRERMATRCKEALSSVFELDSPRAWALRERCRDLWPSTVAGSLGALAHGARGRALLANLLAAHGGIALWRAVAGEPESAT